MGQTKHIGIVGSGIIGLSAGWQLVRQGLAVTLFERDRAGQAASWVASGMLAPYAEVGFEEVDLMELGQYSLSQYPRFLDELHEDAGFAPKLDRCGTLFAGLDRDDTEYLRRLHAFRSELGLQAELLTGSAARECEPLLSPRVTSALWLPDDAQVDNRSLIRALRQAFLNRGGVLHEQTRVQALDIAQGRVRGLDVTEDRYPFEAVVVAAGCWLHDLGGIPVTHRPPIRPVKGQILTLRKTEAFGVRSIVRTPRVYLAAKADGRIRVGATSEEQGFDTRPTAGGVKELLEEAWDVVPAIYDLPLEEVLAGLRPASRDHAPVIGKSGLDGLYYATGHYRHGILLAPITAYGLAEEIIHGRVDPLLERFRPDRFEKRTAAVF